MTRKEIQQLTQERFGKKLPVYMYWHDVPPLMRTLSQLGVGPEKEKDMIPVGVKRGRQEEYPIIYLYKA